MVSGVTSCTVPLTPSNPPNPFPFWFLMSFVGFWLCCCCCCLAGPLRSQGPGKLQACLPQQRYFGILEKGRGRARQKGRQWPGQVCLPRPGLGQGEAQVWVAGVSCAHSGSAFRAAVWDQSRGPAACRGWVLRGRSRCCHDPEHEAFFTSAQRHRETQSREAAGDPLAPEGLGTSKGVASRLGQRPVLVGGGRWDCSCPGGWISSVGLCARQLPAQAPTRVTGADLLLLCSSP